MIELSIEFYIVAGLVSAMTVWIADVALEKTGRMMSEKDEEKFVQAEMGPLGKIADWYFRFFGDEDE